MRAPILIAVAATILAAALAAPAGAAQFIYTPTSGPSCASLDSKPELSSWRCPGPAGYGAVFSDAATMVGVSFGPTGKEKAIVDDDLTWLAGRKAFGDKIEWRMTAGKPYAAILRIWHNEPNPTTGEDQDVGELLVIKVSAEGACRVATVSAQRRDANAAARALADSEATSFRCGINRPTPIGR